MVLSRARGAILWAIFAAVGIAGCNQSLFDAHGDRQDGGPGDGPLPDVPIDVPETCEAPCIADAATHFLDSRWSYLDDRRNRTWTAMVPSGSNAVMSSDSSNRIEACPTANPACQVLSGALLVTTGGLQRSSDPAIQFRSTQATVIQLVFSAYVPSGSPAHKIRLYRNSREDGLAAVMATPGTIVRRDLVVDALPGDRFLVSLEPTTSTGGPIALRFFVRGPFGGFPRDCRIAVPFSDIRTATNSTDDLCGDVMEFWNDTVRDSPQPYVAAGPYPELGDSTSFEPNHFFRGTSPLPQSDSLTVQLWFENGPGSTSPEWLFSNLDPDIPGGMAIRIDNTGSTAASSKLEVFTDMGTVTTPAIVFPNRDTWHFVRAVHANNTLTVCLDGVRLPPYSFTGPRSSPAMPYIGRHVISDSNYFSGEIDDLRVFSAAVPCE